MACPNPGEDGVLVSLDLGRARTIDGLRHELGVWEPKAKPEFIEARDGGFWLARQAMEGAWGELHAFQRHRPGQRPLLRRVAGARRV